MYTDSEPLSVLTSADRLFRIDRLVRVRPVSETRIEIANFAPAELRDVTLLMSIDGGPTNVEVATIDVFAPHGITEIDYPFLQAPHEARTTSGQVVDMSAHRTGIDPATVTFDFTSPTGLAARLAALDGMNWELALHDYNPDNDPESSWALDPEPVHARLYTAIVINWATVVNDPGLRSAFIAEPIIDNDGTTLLTAQEKAALHDRMRGFGRTNLGVISQNVSGLGGGSVLGVHNYVLRAHMRDMPWSDGTYTHEFGHQLGFGHSSTMTYPRDDQGWTVVARRELIRLSDAGALPITQANYYQPGDYAE
ncbi:MAG: hypothetical protein AAF467_16970 [Actinomycetota bacterium]